MIRANVESRSLVDAHKLYSTVLDDLAAAFGELFGLDCWFDNIMLHCQLQLLYTQSIGVAHSGLFGVVLTADDDAVDADEMGGADVQPHQPLNGGGQGQFVDQHQIRILVFGETVEVFEQRELQQFAAERVAERGLQRFRQAFGQFVHRREKEGLFAAEQLFQMLLVTRQFLRLYVLHQQQFEQRKTAVAHAEAAAAAEVAQNFACAQHPFKKHVQNTDGSVAQHRHENDCVVAAFRGEIAEFVVGLRLYAHPPFSRVFADFDVESDCLRVGVPQSVELRFDEAERNQVRVGLQFSLGFSVALSLIPAFDVGQFPFQHVLRKALFESPHAQTAAQNALKYFGGALSDARALNLAGHHCADVIVQKRIRGLQRAAVVEQQKHGGQQSFVFGRVGVVVRHCVRAVRLAPFRATDRFEAVQQRERPRVVVEIVRAEVLISELFETGVEFGLEIGLFDALPFVLFHFEAFPVERLVKVLFGDVVPQPHSVHFANVPQRGQLFDHPLPNDEARLGAVGFHVRLQLFLLFSLSVFVNRLNRAHTHNRRHCFVRGLVRHRFGCNLFHQLGTFPEPYCVQIQFVAFVFAFEQQIFVRVFDADAEVVFGPDRNGHPFVVEHGPCDGRLSFAGAADRIRPRNFHVARRGAQTVGEVQIVQRLKQVNRLPPFGLAQFDNVAKQVEVVVAFEGVAHHRHHFRARNYAQFVQMQQLRKGGRPPIQPQQTRHFLRADAHVLLAFARVDLRGDYGDSALFLSAFLFALFVVVVGDGRLSRRLLRRLLARLFRVDVVEYVFGACVGFLVVFEQVEKASFDLFLKLLILYFPFGLLKHIFEGFQNQPQTPIIFCLQICKQFLQLFLPGLMLYLEPGRLLNVLVHFLGDVRVVVEYCLHTFEALRVIATSFPPDEGALDLAQGGGGLDAHRLEDLLGVLLVDGLAGLRS